MNTKSNSSNVMKKLFDPIIESVECLDYLQTDINENKKKNSLIRRSTLRVESN